MGGTVGKVSYHLLTDTMCDGVGEVSKSSLRRRMLLPLTCFALCATYLIYTGCRNLGFGLDTSTPKVVLSVASPKSRKIQVMPTAFEE